MPKLTKRLIDQNGPRVKDYIVWCDELKGFGIRVFASGQKSFLIQYRDEHERTRRFTIGRYGHLTPDQARTEAMKQLGSVRMGNNPSEERRHKRSDMTIRELCDQYIEDVSSGRYKTRFNRPKKESTILTDIGRVETHIKPLLGKRPVGSIDRRTVEKFMSEREQIVWSTKYRYKVLQGDIQKRIREIIRRVCSENSVDIISGVVSGDHVHMFISMPPKLSMSDFMRKVKGRSSYLIQRGFPALKKRYWGQRFWGRGYFSTTNGAITEDVVLQYLENHTRNPTGASR